MTRNIYLGGNIFHPIGAPDLDTFKQRAGELWAEVQKTDFAGTRASPARAGGPAHEAGSHRPAGGRPLAPQPGRPVRWEHDSFHAGRLRLPEEPAARAQAERAEVQRGRGPAGGRHRGADRPGLRRAPDDARRDPRQAAQRPEDHRRASARTTTPTSAFPRRPGRSRARAAGPPSTPGSRAAGSGS